MKYCEYCDVVTEDGTGICASCGGSEFYRKCTSCGKRIPAGNLCTACLEARNKQTRPSDFDTSRPGTCNKYISLALCICLGPLGAHKFYEGNIGMGILYIFTAGLFGIGWFVDIFLILAKPTQYLP